ncbi:hypothetical protein AAG906_041105 [Vitis piasezkii]
MQRWCAKLGSLATSSWQNQPFMAPQWRRLLHHSPQFHRSLPSASITTSNFVPLFSAAASSSMAAHFFRSSLLPLYVVPVRHFSSKDKNKRRPITPVTSKIKKIKMKSYSSFKMRFRVMNDGNIRRWREGKRHNAHLKSKKAKRRLRQPALVPAAYAKVMKKLNFCA